MKNIFKYKYLFFSIFLIVGISFMFQCFSISNSSIKVGTIEKLNGNNDCLTITEVLDNKYNDLTDDVTLLMEDEDLSQLSALSGVKKMAFSFQGDIEFDDLEITLNINNFIGKDTDVLAIYYYDESRWIIHGFYEIVDTHFIMETDKLGKYAIVNKSEGERDLSPIITNPSRNSDRNFRNNLAVSKSYTSDEEIVVTHYGSNTYADELEFFNVTFKTSETGKLSFKNKNIDDDSIMYFENCIFDGVSLSFEAKGHYVFNNCTFVNSPIGSVELIGQGVNVYIYNSLMTDNNPNKEEFNSDPDTRSYKFSAVGFRRSDGSAHIVRTIIQKYYASRTIYETQNVENNRLYFEYSNINNVEGQAIGLYSSIKGRIDHNEFYNIGELRGTNGFEVTSTDYLGGNGVGGNAVFSTGRSREMRVYNNNIKNVMEDAIEGFFYSITDNNIDTTGYRYEEGFETVSTQAISGGTWIITGNVIKNVHGRGIILSRWDNVPSIIKNNTIIKGDRNVTEEMEGIKVTPNESSYANVMITDNVVDGFVYKYRVINSAESGLQNFIINDKGYGSLIGSVFSSLSGVQFESDRQVNIEFANSNFLNATDSIIDDWGSKDVYSFEQKEDGVKYGSFTSKKAHGEVFQTIDLPKESTLVCLSLKLRSNADALKISVTSKNDDGEPYSSNDEGSYSGYKIPLYNFDSTSFKDHYICFKAINHTTIGIYVEGIDKTVDIQKIKGHYMVNSLYHKEEVKNDNSNDVQGQDNQEVVNPNPNNNEDNNNNKNNKQNHYNDVSTTDDNNENIIPTDDKDIVSSDDEDIIPSDDKDKVTSDDENIIPADDDKIEDDKDAKEIIKNKDEKKDISIILLVVIIATIVITFGFIIIKKNNVVKK